MRVNVLIGCVAMAAFTPALAATGTPPPSSSHNPAVKDRSVVLTRNVAGGANSYTRGQAEWRIMKAGVDHVQHLTKDAHGVWRGTAMRGAHRVNVALDYKGHVTLR
ncbi:MAG: hypothetical protein H0X36_04165 [Sphingomonadaceae bacterium]|nr:hypothetical protein [Sphingomonadaceae bacterium]